ncbi:orotidine-5'-phosphate decarboxylase [Goodfellowiella coeruleoviolacea]|uniref:orotidine-5'-phosphate decarboxylase n=1 Tax=Goodfellowiella coeruleoviolacea TaxID=334858 RepID=UPI0020A312DB|nr:orotidine-5'-phosphate decarboxylase [Goodfellowiella coeruleoviolacea]
MNPRPFGARLTEAVAARGPLCVGIDPHPGLLRDWGLSVDVAGLERFAMTCVAALAEDIAVLKPQSAFFEAFGSAGVAVLERVIAEARQAGTVVLLDAKRGDIGSTMAAYASAYLTDGSPLAADAVTLSPYLGFGSLEPALTAARASGRGVFVLAATSNPEAGELQGALVPADPPGPVAAPTSPGRAGPAGRSVAQSVVAAAAARNAGLTPLGDVGVVIGATLGRNGGDAPEFDLTGLNGPILAPGFGAQGATVADLARLFGDNLRHVLPTSSRDVLRHGPNEAALRDAALRTRDEVSALREGHG